MTNAAEVLQHMPNMGDFAVPPLSEGWRQLPPVHREPPRIDSARLAAINHYLAVTAQYDEWRYLHAAWHGKTEPAFTIA